MPLAVSEWGMAGIEALREKVAVLVIVDVAVSSGAVVYPFPYGEPEAAQEAADRTARA